MARRAKIRRRKVPTTAPQKSRASPDLAMIAKDFIIAKDLCTYKIIILRQEESFVIT
jgi:hypothetical protein